MSPIWVADPVLGSIWKTLPSVARAPTRTSGPSRPKASIAGTNDSPLNMPCRLPLSWVQAAVSGSTRYTRVYEMPIITPPSSIAMSVMVSKPDGHWNAPMRVTAYVIGWTRNRALAVWAKTAALPPVSAPSMPPSMPVPAASGPPGSSSSPTPCAEGPQAASRPRTRASGRRMRGQGNADRRGLRGDPWFMVRGGLRGAGGAREEPRCGTARS